MSGDTQLMLMIAGMHMLGLVCAAVLLIPALRDHPNPPPGPPDSDDGGGHGPQQPLAPAGPSGDNLPLPDAQPARVRLRDHGRLADHVPRRERRPAREPEREPARTATGW